MREAGLERQRQEEGRDSLRNLNSIQEEILQLNQLLEPGPAPDDITAYITRGNQLCSQVSEVVRTTAEVRSSSDLRLRIDLDFTKTLLLDTDVSSVPKLLVEHLTIGTAGTMEIKENLWRVNSKLKKSL